MMHWYVLFVRSGFEDKVLQTLLETLPLQSAAFQEQFGECLIPKEQHYRVQRGKRVLSEKKLFPGYVFVRMTYSPELWNDFILSALRAHQLIDTRNRDCPPPLSEEESKRIIEQAETASRTVQNAVYFRAGESVRICDGPFETMRGTVISVDTERERLQVEVSIFGRATPVELAYTQVSHETRDASSSPHSASDF